MNKFYNGYQIIEVDESLEESVKITYIDLIKSQGYLPVESSSTKPDNSTFVWYEEELTLNESKTAYEVNWKPYYLEILLDSNKILAHPVILANIEQISELFKTDSKLCDWLFKKCTYIRNSEMAAYACDALGMTAEEMEALVLDCMV